MVGEHGLQEDPKTKYSMAAFAVALSFDSMATFLSMLINLVFCLSD